MTVQETINVIEQTARTEAYIDTIHKILGPKFGDLVKAEGPENMPNLLMALSLFSARMYAFGAVACAKDKTNLNADGRVGQDLGNLVTAYINNGCSLVDRNGK